MPRCNGQCTSRNSSTMLGLFRIAIWRTKRRTSLVNLSFIYYYCNHWIESTQQAVVGCIGVRSLLAAHSAADRTAVRRRHRRLSLRSRTPRRRRGTHGVVCLLLLLCDWLWCRWWVVVGRRCHRCASGWVPTAWRRLIMAARCRLAGYVRCITTARFTVFIWFFLFFIYIYCRVLCLWIDFAAAQLKFEVELVDYVTKKNRTAVLWEEAFYADLQHATVIYQFVFVFF